STRRRMAWQAHETASWVPPPLRDTFSTRHCWPWGKRPKVIRQGAGRPILPLAFEAECDEGRPSAERCPARHPDRRVSDDGALYVPDWQSHEDSAVTELPRPGHLLTIVEYAALGEDDQ